jgi:hypothetical protein
MWMEAIKTLFGGRVTDGLIPYYGSGKDDATIKISRLDAVRAPWKPLTAQ